MLKQVSLELGVIVFKAVLPQLFITLTAASSDITVAIACSCAKPGDLWKNGKRNRGNLKELQLSKKLPFARKIYHSTFQESRLN